MTFATRLNAAIVRKRSMTCVGLDPRRDSLPAGIRDAVASNTPDEWAAAYTTFCCGVIDVVADLVPCVKPQVAFFEQLGPAGSISLGQVIEHASRAGLQVIIDAKRNDIGSTAEAYADAYLGSHRAVADHRSVWGGDALTVSPYLGGDSLQPFVDVCDRRAAGIFVLVKTSNPGGGDFQDRLIGDRPLYGHVADMITTFNQSRRDSDGYGPVGAVVGATYPEQLMTLRATLPSSILLVPGFGAQGGSADDVKAARDDNGVGAIVNSSRHIIFAHTRPEYASKYGDDRWQDAVRAATLEMNAQLE
ncbi:MAG: orotidine-5'-phosphate decarboxylase [Planctomycetota bacterium]